MGFRNRQGFRRHHAVQRVLRSPSDDREVPLRKSCRSLRTDDQRPRAVSRGADHGRVISGATGVSPVSRSASLNHATKAKPPMTKMETKAVAAVMSCTLHCAPEGSETALGPGCGRASKMLPA